MPKLIMPLYTQVPAIIILVRDRSLTDCAFNAQIYKCIAAIGESVNNHMKNTRLSVTSDMINFNNSKMKIFTKLLEVMYKISFVTVTNK